MRLGFATDIHLDFLGNDKGYTKQRGAGRYIARGHDALVIGGDISTGPKFKEHFRAFSEGAAVPVYFILGNHDFWDSPEAEVRAAASTFPGYLDTVGVVEMSPQVALVGRTGWYDTLTGNPFESKIRVQDWQRTERLVNCWRVPHLLHQECRRWSEEEAARARPVLEAAAEGYEQVFFVTHFPCFPEACWDEQGRPDVVENGWWPWSIQTTLGRAIREVTDKHRRVQFTLLTGHTHGGGRAQLTPNLTAISGRASYGNPRLAESWTL